MMIYIIYKILVLFKIIRILKCFLRNTIDFYFFLKNNFFPQHIIMNRLRLRKDKNIEENIIKHAKKILG